MKFILLVEGETEDLGVPGFINRWLSAQFEQGIGVQTVSFHGWADLRDGAPQSAKMYLTDPNYTDVIAVISLLDLYGPTFYPDDLTSVRERYTFGRDYMVDRVKTYFKKEGLSDLASKYRHYFAVHETEAWLVSQPNLFPKEIKEALAKQKPPEQINFKTPPAKLLNNLYLEKFKQKYKKTTFAKNHFPKLDANSAAEQCPYLKQMLHELRDEALKAGAKPVGNWAKLK